MSDRFSVVYKIAGNLEQAAAKAKQICIEQTVEFPPAHIGDPYILNTIIGQIVSLTPSDQDAYLAEISYAAESAGYELTQFLNVLFGNSSINPGIRIERIQLGDSLTQQLRGPRFGIQGIREILGVHDRPLLSSAVKPMGTSVPDLARLAGQLTLGGLDMIKDDHGLADQRFSPFHERVTRVAEAVRAAEQKTGCRCLYAPNITADGDETIRRAHLAKAAGAGALVISPALCGFGFIKQIAADETIALPILFHPALAGSFTVHADSGISHAALYGQIARIAGADATIFPNFGGRFSFARQECAAIAQAACQPMGHRKPIFPMPGGGLTLESIPDMVKFYGKEVIFLIGGGLFSAGPNLIDNCQKFKKLAGG